jgi:hypothetical protein
MPLLLNENCQYEIRNKQFDEDIFISAKSISQAYQRMCSNEFQYGAFGGGGLYDPDTASSA